MSTYEERLRRDKKIELSQKITSAIVDDIWCMSYMAADAQEFVDYLMTITDQEAVEEFFNKCHDQGGRFCGGGNGGTGRGPGTHNPAPIHYIKQQAKEKLKTTRERRNSAPLQKVTTSPGRRGFDIATSAVGLGPLGAGLGFNPGGFGTVKIHRLQKAKLSNFGTKDLNTLKTRLQASQRQYNFQHSMGWANVAAGAAMAALKTGGNPVVGGIVVAAGAIDIGISRWKTKRIPAQIERIDRTLAKRAKLSSDDYIELALDDSNLPSLAEEIAIAKKEIESGNFPKVSKLSESDLKDVENLLSDIDDDDDLTPEQIKAVKESLANYKKYVK